MRMRAKHLMFALFENKMQTFTACFLRKEMRMQAKHSMLLRLIIICRHCAVYFLGINEDASKAINASSLNHKMPELCSLFSRKVRIWAKHLMLLLFNTSNVHISIEIDVDKVLNTSS